MSRDAGSRDGMLAGAAAAVALLAVLLYLPSLGGGFLNWDDEWLVVGNLNLASGGDVLRILDPGAWRAGLGAEYLPLRDLSFWLDRRLFGLDPFGYRLENALLHGLVCALAVFALLDLTRSRIAAAIGALLFAAHPLHVESVAWISERKGLLAAAFLLGALLAYRRGRRAGSRAWYAAAVGLFLLAALSKSTVHFLGPLLVALEWLDARREGRPRRLLRWTALALPFLAISVAAVALNARHQAEAGAVYGWDGASVLTAVRLVSSTAVRQVGHFLLPVGLSAEYELAKGPLAWASVAVLLVLLGAAALAVRRGWPAAPAAVFTVFAWLPVSNLLVLPNPMADRYAFLPSLGAAGLAGLAFAAVIRRAGAIRIAAVAVLAAAAVALGALSVDRMAVWHDSLALWTDAVAKAPGSGRARQNLGDALLQVGEERAAFEQFDRMIEVEPETGEWYVFVAQQYRDAGDEAAAERILREGCRRTPDNPGPRINLATLLIGRARGGPRHRASLEEAEALLREASEGEGHRYARASALLNLGTLEFLRRRLASGVEITKRAIEAGLLPADEILAQRNLAEAMRLSGRPAEAKRHAARAARLAERLGPDAP